MTPFLSIRRFLENFCSLESIDKVKFFPEKIKIVQLITDQPNAKVIHVANRYSIQISLLSFCKKVNLSRKKQQELQESCIIKIINNLDVDIIFLAGYMKILTKKVEGSKIQNKFSKSTHLSPMYSLSNGFSEDELIEFDERVKGLMSLKKGITHSVKTCLLLLKKS